MADNFSPSDRSGCGNNALSRQRAEQCLLNADVNAVARIGRSFRPLYGHKEYDLNEDHAQSLFTLRTDSCIYVAAFNFTSSQQSFAIPLQDLDIPSGRQISDIKELWLQRQISQSGSRFTFNVPARDARLFRIRLVNAADAVRSTSRTESQVLHTTDFDLQGRPALPYVQSALLLRRTTYADGTTQTRKMIQ